MVRCINAAVYLHDYTEGYRTCIDHIECYDDYTGADYLEECECNGCDWLEGIRDHYVIIEIEEEYEE